MSYLALAGHKNVFGGGRASSIKTGGRTLGGGASASSTGPA